MSFRNRLKTEITNKGFLLKEVADKAEIPKRTLDTYVDKRGIIPPADVAVRLAKIFDVSVEYLVTGKNSKFPQFFETGGYPNFVYPCYNSLKLSKKSPEEILEIEQMYEKIQNLQIEIERLKRSLAPEKYIETYLNEDIDNLIYLYEKLKDEETQVLLALDEKNKEIEAFFDSEIDEELRDIVKKLELINNETEIQGKKQSKVLAFINKIRYLNKDEIQIISSLMDTFSKNRDSLK